MSLQEHLDRPLEHRKALIMGWTPHLKKEHLELLDI